MEASPRLSRRLVAVLVAVLVGALATWLLLIGDDEGDAGPGGLTSTLTTPSGPSSATGSSSPSPTGPATSPSARPPTSPSSPATLKPVRVTFGEDVDLGNGVNVDIVDIEAVQGKGGRPGEVGGPSVRFTVRVSNESGEAINLDLAVVNAYFGPDESPATQLQEPGGVALPQLLPDGGSATGKYIFNIPPDERDQVRVEFVYTAEAPMIIYTGAAEG